MAPGPEVSSAGIDKKQRLSAWLAAVGFLSSLVLELVHVRTYLSPGEDSYCSVGQRFDCVSVAASSTSVFLGLPWAVWGAAGFLSIWLAVLLRSRWQLILTSVAALASLALLGVELWIVGSVCLLCEWVHLLAWASCAVAWSNRAAPQADLGNKKTLWSIFALPASLTLVVWLFFPADWGAFNYRNAPPYPTGVTAEGYPWIGAEEPKLVIHEFTDYHCPHCAVGTVRTLALLRTHPGLRIVRRQHPRMACHEGNCTSVRLAYCAGEQGKFWRGDRWLFAHAPGRKPVDPEQMARDLSLDLAQLSTCRDRADIQLRAQIDSIAARKARIVDTPGYLVDGKMVRASKIATVIRERAR